MDFPKITIRTTLPGWGSPAPSGATGAAAPPGATVWSASAAAGPARQAPVGAPVPGFRVLASGAAASPTLFPAATLCWDDFLPPPVHARLFAMILGERERFAASKVDSHDGTRGLNSDYRRSLVLVEPQPVRDLLLPLLLPARAQALRFFGLDRIPLGRVELQVTGSGGGDFFRIHTDDNQSEYFNRLLTFVLYLHGQPRRFSGGAMRLYDSRMRPDGREPADSWVDVDPRDNRLVMFPSDRYHAVQPTELATDEFADRRFTVNGWYWAEGDLHALLGGQPAAPGT